MDGRSNCRRQDKPASNAQDLSLRLAHPFCPTHAGFLIQAPYEEVLSSAQPTSVHRACDEGGGDQGEMDLKVWPERCSVHIIR